jgi:hypothetical protein
MKSTNPIICPVAGGHVSISGQKKAAVPTIVATAALD